MFCKHCGKEINDNAVICVHCGCAVGGADFDCDPQNRSPKSKITALLLCFFAGWLGVHRFYVGKIGTGILMLFTFGLFGIMTLVDLITIACGSFSDSEGKILR